MKLSLILIGICFGIVVNAFLDQDILTPKAPCCTKAESTINLSRSHVSFTSDDPSIHIEPINQPNGQQGECNGMAFIKATFQSPEEGTSGCVDKPQCGRTMLKLQLELDAKNPVNTISNRYGHMVNIGDSVSNDGWGGDGSDQLCDAEIHATIPHTSVYNSDQCGGGLLEDLHDIFGAANKFVTIYVSNEFVNITNDVGIGKHFCSRCLFCLNEQPGDPNGNYDIYIGLNRVVNKYSDRTGKGICKATLSWECPCFW